MRFLGAGPSHGYRSPSRFPETMVYPMILPPMILPTSGILTPWNMVETDLSNVAKNMSHLQHKVVPAGSSRAQRITLRGFVKRRGIRIIDRVQRSQRSPTSPCTGSNCTVQDP